MIMGMQRSGTTALFETLRTGPNLVSYEESADGLIYDDYFLRPEFAIRHVLRATRYPILLKPIRESERRTLASVIDEYADYKLSILWLYRDPVNVIFSYYAKGWVEATTPALAWAAREWVARNRRLIQLPAALRPKLTVLRYESLVSDGSVLRALERKLGIHGNSTLRPDPNTGRTQLPLTTQALIDEITSKTLLELHRFPTGLVSRRSWLWKRKRAFATIPASSPLEKDQGEAHAADVHASVGIDFESEGFQCEPYACLRRLREYRRVHHSQISNVQWLSAYDEVSGALHDSKHFGHQESRLLKDNPSRGEQRLLDAIAGAAVHDRAVLTSSTLEDRALAVFTPHFAIGRFNLADVCLIAVAAMFYRMLGVNPGSPDGLFEQAIRGEPVEVLSNHFSRDGWISRVAAQASLSSADLRRFLEFGSYYHWVTAIFALSAVHFLLGEPSVLNGVRRAPDKFPAAFRELTRLNYPLIVVERWTSRAVEIAGRKIPARKRVYLSIGAANRDPDVFERPDEFLVGRCMKTTKKPLSGYMGACAARAHWEGWGLLACEALLKVLLTKCPKLEPTRPVSESKFTISPSSGSLRQALQIPFLRYLRTFEVKFQT